MINQSSVTALKKILNQLEADSWIDYLSAESLVDVISKSPIIDVGVISDPLFGLDAVISKNFEGKNLSNCSQILAHLETPCVITLNLNDVMSQQFYFFLNNIDNNKVFVSLAMVNNEYTNIIRDYGLVVDRGDFSIQASFPKEGRFFEEINIGDSPASQMLKHSGVFLVETLVALCWILDSGRGELKHSEDVGEFNIKELVVY